MLVTWWRNYAILGSILILACLTAVIYFPSLSNGFCLDDTILFSAAYPRQIQELPYLLTEPVQCRIMHYYRPLAFFTFVLDYNLWGEKAAGYHLTNLLLSIATSSLVFLFLRLFVGNFPAFIGALFFVVFPGHSEAILSIYNRSQILSTAFILLSLLIFYRLCQDESPNSICLLFSFLFPLLGCLSKENAIVIPALSILLALYLQPLKSLYPKIVLGLFLQALACALYLILRYSALGCLGMPEVDNAIGEPSLVRIYWTTASLLFRYLAFCLWPFPLSCDYPEMGLNFSWAGIFFPLLMGFIFWAFQKREARVYAFAFLFFGISILPVLPFVPLQILFAERFLYSAFPAACLSIGALSEKFLPTRPRMVLGFSFVFAIFWAFCTFQRNGDWKDNATLWRQTLSIQPQSYRAYLYLGAEAARAQRWGEALEYYAQARLRKPNRHNALLIAYNEAVVYLALKEEEKARQTLEKSEAQYGDYLPSLLLLGDLATRAQETGKALVCYEKAWAKQNRWHPQYLATLDKIGALLFQQKKWREAKFCYEKALSDQKDTPEIWRKLGILEMEREEYKEAERYLQEAKKRSPQDYRNDYLLYFLYRKQGRNQQSQYYYHEAQKKAPAGVSLPE